MMPLGKYGMGIEGYSALNNPEISPISNFFCKGYQDNKKFPLNKPLDEKFKFQKG